ncbi:TATA box-binding protein-associated factor RNA polymerase I subunit C-like isoform X2 [Physella acuta]|uniref:TATA box-binding protein-associated factor RNA polymerase I subunit C-like isoform X2 n=1 Tax=Physella acuta TaxID=109671 RepID=UPI0027DB1368|nr:TATA box-binding protein-associated factor RNA polymerase I subunit C-like isoform X2 [Physella acuta]
MELPNHYLPVHACQHAGLKLNHRFMFAEYGSYKNVDTTVDDEAQQVTMCPQKGQGSLANLSDVVPTLPLFEHPLMDNWKECDYIMGVKNFVENQNDLKYLVTTLPHYKTLIHNNPADRFSKDIMRLKELVWQCCENPGEPSNTEQFQCDGGMQTIISKYLNVQKAYNKYCLNGFNPDFSGGLLSVVPTTERDFLIHASGPRFQDIRLSQVLHEETNVVPTGLQHSQYSSSGPVFQVVSKSLTTPDKVLICLRQKQKCVLLSVDLTLMSFVEQADSNDLKISVTSTSFSPYLENEILLSAAGGCVYLWDVNSTPRKIVEKAARFESVNEWTSAYFSGHPRQVVVADSTSVELFDHRSQFTCGLELFTLCNQLNKAHERVMTAAALGFPYHLAVTDFSLFVMDQRFTATPVLQFSLESIASPQYIEIINNISNTSENLIFLASQQPAEVMCFHVNVQQGLAPTSTVLPWKVSPIGEFYHSLNTSDFWDWNSMERRFQASLAGLAVSRPTEKLSALSVYQLDSYGDVFCQRIRLDEMSETMKVTSSTSAERRGASDRSSRWVQSFDDITRCRFLSEDVVTRHHLQVPLDENLMDAIFSPPLDASPPVIRCATTIKRKLKPVEKLPCQGFSTQLHLALLKNEDISDILKNREAYHQEQKKMMRQIVLDEMANKKSHRKEKSRTPSKRKSKMFVCETLDSSSDE